MMAMEGRLESKRPPMKAMRLPSPEKHGNIARRLRCKDDGAQRFFGGRTGQFLFSRKRDMPGSDTQDSNG